VGKSEAERPTRDAQSTKEYFETLVSGLRNRNGLVSKAVESAQAYCFQDDVLYLQYPPPILFNISAKILTDSGHKPILDEGRGK
jgi:hypothetical protein